MCWENGLIYLHMVLWTWGEWGWGRVPLQLQVLQIVSSRYSVVMNLIHDNSWHAAPHISPHLIHSSLFTHRHSFSSHFSIFPTFSSWSLTLLFCLIIQFSLILLGVLLSYFLNASPVFILFGIRSLLTVFSENNLLKITIVTHFPFFCGRVKKWNFQYCFLHSYLTAAGILLIVLI